jgi:DNA-binding MarR family transcriptional regulator
MISPRPWAVQLHHVVGDLYHLIIFSASCIDAGAASVIRLESCGKRRVVSAKRSPTTPAAGELERVAAFRAELRRFLLRTNSVATREGLSSQRYDLMLMIRSAGELRVTELCDLLQLQQTAVTQLVKRTEDAGLIERRPSPDDGRVWLLRLTAAGEERLMSVIAGLREEGDALAEALSRVDARLRAATG